MPRSLVTGAAGFIGSHLVDYLVAQKHEVTALDDLSGGYCSNINDQADFRRMSVVDRAGISALFKDKRFDYVDHLAAYAAEGLSHHIRHHNYTVNLLGTTNLINAAVNVRGVRCFVFASSAAVYGDITPPFHEAQCPRPIDPYGIAKYAAELDLEAAHRLFSLPYLVFRLNNVYGPRQNLSDPYRNVIGIFIRRAMEGGTLPVFGSGSQQRAFTYVSDIVPTIAKSVHVCNHHNQAFNLGNDCPVSIIDLIGSLEQELGKQLELQRQPARGEVDIVYQDTRKAKGAFGLRGCETELATGIQQMVKWAKSAHIGKRTEEPIAIEVRQCLPPIWSELQK